jgi:hypothetical protein
VSREACIDGPLITLQEQPLDKGKLLRDMSPHIVPNRLNALDNAFPANAS